MPTGEHAEARREALVHTLGNLTLLPQALNSRQSNGPWLGDDGKRAGLKEFNAFFMNRPLAEADQWAEADIESRTQDLCSRILRIWPVPVGHSVNVGAERVDEPKRHVDLPDLIAAGVLTAGMTLLPRQPRHAQRSAVLLADGRIDVEGVVFESASKAAGHITSGPVNGWWFFLTQRNPRRSLGDVRRDYLDQLPDEGGDADESGDDGDDD